MAILEMFFSQKLERIVVEDSTSKALLKSSNSEGSDKEVELYIELNSSRGYLQFCLETSKASSMAEKIGLTV